MVNLKKLTDIRKMTCNHNFNGVISVIDESEVILSEGFGEANFEHHVPITGKTRFRIASITKQFTATAILQLAKRDLLKLDDTVDQYIPDFPKGDQITIHHILTHTSGISNFDLDMDFYDVLHSESVLKALIDLFKYEPLQSEPGVKFAYSISGFLLLGYIIEKVSGINYENYISKYIFEPLQMTHSGYDHWKSIIRGRANPYEVEKGVIVNADHVDMRIAGAGGALYSTIEDMQIFNLALKSGKLLGPEMTKKMFTNQFLIAEGVHSGYGIFLQNVEFFGKVRRKEYHMGGGPGVRSINAYYPDDELMITIITNVNDRDQFAGVLDEVERILLT